MKVLILLTLILFLGGCDFVATALDFINNANSTVEKPPLYNYKADMLITIGDKKFKGLAVADIKDSQIIKIKSKARLYVLSIETCSRHFTVDRADENWFGGVGHEFEYHFKPNEKEKRGSCPMYIKAIDLNGTAAWGMVHFRTDESLPAYVSCNGPTLIFNGLTVCQTKSSLIQTIRFNHNVTKYVASDKCKLEKISDFNFELRPTNGFCFITFFANEQIHRSVFLGFNEVFVRGD